MSGRAEHPPGSPGSSGEDAATEAINNKVRTMANQNGIK